MTWEITQDTLNTLIEWYARDRVLIEEYEDTKKKEVSRLKEKGMNVWMMADRIGTTVEEIEGLLNEH